MCGEAIISKGTEAIELAKSIVRTGKSIDSVGNEIDAHAFCSAEQIDELCRIVARNTHINRTLEIGCAFGVSALALAGSLAERSGASHTALDPMQSTFWKGAGIAALQRSGLGNWEVCEEYSEYKLPKLAQSGEKYDLIFIDGWHTFDHALIDAFYATKMLNVGGFLALDDTDMPGLWKLVSYLMNYDCYSFYSEAVGYGGKATSKLAPPSSGIRLARSIRPYLPSFVQRRIQIPRMVVLRKIAEDERPWNWYQAF